MSDVALVSMPFAAPQRPSIALGILKSTLRRAGIGSVIHHANLWWAEVAALKGGVALALKSKPEFLLAEWMFASAAFPDFQPDAQAYYELIGRGCDEEFASAVDELRALSPAFIDMAAQRVLSGRPRVVGCTSMFEQHSASIGLLRRVRELDEGVITIMGGANCEGPMGQVTHSAFPWIDFVVNGEAEDVFPKLCREVFDEGREVRTILPGVHAPWHRSEKPERAPERQVIGRMDTSPAPDYDDYFATLGGLAISDHIAPALLAEASRGCWWGQKHHCTFCGLNGSGMNYRSKSSERVLEELDHLSERYQLKNIAMVDNIIDLHHLKTVLPKIIESPRKLNLFYETKANLRREQVATLAAAGAHWIQPGIESLNDEVLQIMDKGTTALINLQLLKWAREYGVRLSWNILMGFPGEKPEWYAKIAMWIPLVSHLQPPGWIGTVRYDRFSRYHISPEEYGLELKPFPSYPYVYPLGEAELSDLAYYFEDETNKRRRLGEVPEPPYYYPIKRAVYAWEMLHRGQRPILGMTDDGTRLSIIDTRPLAPSRRTTIEGLAREVYLACDAARSFDKLATSFPEAEGRLQKVLNDLVGRRLLLNINGRYFALAVPGELPELPLRPPDGNIMEFPEQVGTCQSRLRDMASASGVELEAVECRT